MTKKTADGKRQSRVGARPRKRAEEALRQLTHDLDERVKELECLYSVAQLVEKPGVSLEEIAQGTANLIPPSWQYPEVTCARIILEGQEFRTENFSETPWRQTTDITVHGEPAGTVEVCYLEERPESDEGPFQKEERSLINAIAERLGRIAERKRTEDALRLQGEIMANMTEAVYLIRASDGVIVYTNPAFEKLFGYSPGEMAAKHVSVVNAATEKSPEEKAEEIIAALDRTGVWRGEILNIKKDGTPFWSYANVSTFDHPRHGRVWVAYHTDITERKLVQEAFERVSRQHKLILESAGDGISGLDLNGCMTFANPAAARMVGRDVEELIGQLAHDVMHHSKPDGTPYPQEECPIHAALRDGAVHHVTEEVFWRKDGTSVPVECVSTPIRENGELVGAVVTFKDLSERKQVEEAVKKAREELETKVERQMLRPNPYGLSFREVTVLHLVAAGRSDKEIATLLSISPRTASNHVEHILAKMEAACRTEAAARAIREDLIA